MSNAGLTPNEYFEEIVYPAIDDFHQSPASRRHAYSAAISAYHLGDYIKCALEEVAIKHQIDPRAGPPSLSGIHRAMEACTRSFIYVQGFSIGAKHRIVTSKNIKHKSVSGADTLMPTFVPLNLRRGRSLGVIDKPTVVILDESYIVQVYACVLDVVCHYQLLFENVFDSPLVGKMKPIPYVDHPAA